VLVVSLQVGVGFLKRQVGILFMPERGNQLNVFKQIIAKQIVGKLGSGLEI
jgi:hypothetical protein